MVRHVAAAAILAAIATPVSAGSLERGECSAAFRGMKSILEGTAELHQEVIALTAISVAAGAITQEQRFGDMASESAKKAHDAMAKTRYGRNELSDLLMSLCSEFIQKKYTIKKKTHHLRGSLRLARKRTPAPPAPS